RAPSEFDETTSSRFHLDIYLEEWGVFFCHAGQSSRIRVTDMAFVHGRDDFQLLGVTPQLKDIGWLFGTSRAGTASSSCASTPTSARTCQASSPRSVTGSRRSNRP